MGNFHALLLAAPALAAIAASGCTRYVSEGIRDDGTAERLVFSAADDAVLGQGTFPDPAHLRALGDRGATKEQLYAALGRPHFPAGFAGVREWDYLFHFRDGEHIATCQYKVIFDSAGHVGSSHWQPAECSARAQASAGTP